MRPRGSSNYAAQPQPGRSARRHSDLGLRASDFPPLGRLVRPSLNFQPSTLNRPRLCHRLARTWQPRTRLTSSSCIPQPPQTNEGCRQRAISQSAWPLEMTPVSRKRNRNQCRFNSPIRQLAGGHNPARVGWATVAGAREKKLAARRRMSSRDVARAKSPLNWWPNLKLAAK